MKQTWILLSILFLVAITFRLPGTKFDLGSLNFCDESIYVEWSMNRITDDSAPVPHFKSGGVNFFFPKYAGKAYLTLTGKNISLDDLRLLCRYIANVFLNGLGVIFLFLAVLNMTANRRAAYFSALMYALCPLLTASTTWFYPDSFVAFFTIFVLFSISLILKNRHNRRSCDVYESVLYGILGVSVATVFSTKFTGMLFHALFAWLMVIRYLDESKNTLSITSLWRTIYGSRFIILSYGLGFVLAFVMINPDAITNWGGFLKALQVDHYQASERPLVGFKYYSFLMFICSCGVGFPSSLAILVLKRDRSSLLQWVMMISIPIVLLAIIGRYNLLFSRNINIIVPCIIVAVAIGFARLKYSLSQNLCWIISIASILPWSLSQLKQDLEEDSRFVIQKYLASQNLNKVASNGGCGPHPYTNYNEHWGNVVALDSWWGGINADGTFRQHYQATAEFILFRTRHFRDLHFIAERSWKVPGHIKSQYEVVKTFAYGGPVVFFLGRRSAPTHAFKPCRGDFCPKDF